MYSIEQRDEQLRGTTAAITYTLGFDRAAQHLITVRMRIDSVTGSSVTVVMPSWSPGSYKIRDYAGYQGNVTTWVGTGAARKRTTSNWRDKASLVIDTQGASTVEIDYVIYAHERTVRTNHVNRFHAFLVPTAVCMYVEGRTNEIHHVLLTHDVSTWPSVSTSLSPVQAPSSQGMLLGALNYDVLADSPIEIGDHQIQTFDLAGAKHEVAVPTNFTLDVSWLTEQIKRIVTVEAGMFGGVPYDRYVFIIQVYPGAGGGLEHARSSVNAVDPSAMLDKSKVIGLLSLLCHEYFHLWNVKRIRPIELGPFDYTRETYTPMLWLAEGLTSYYDDLLAYRCGFSTAKEYIEILSKDHIGKLATVQGRSAMSTRDSSTLAWLKLYMASPDGSNRFPSYYLKGGVIILLLDVYLIDHSDGKYSLDDAMRAFWTRYQADSSKGLTEDEVIELIEGSTKIQIKDRLMAWLNGTTELPYNEILEAVGLKVMDTPKAPEPVKIGEAVAFANVPPAPYLGMAVAEIGGKVVVRAVDDGSPAAQAGIGIDDEIVAIEGRRVASPANVDHYCGARIGMPTVLTGHCDGRLYTATITPLAQPTLRVVEIEQPTDRQKEMRNRWLRKTI
ncbi:MAG: M61 family metallopeptidase [Candidatus Kapabacteria bacterium]|nr:M61 family metallopeptidase [Ignavibacteria bacterium]MBK6420235.1 M61 family metallopeptidase [Ignavibacteria bacterium]MBK7412815.1 M61 family metallopeptidase [Ignavibacteria bacterium]MBP6509582.1 M61 family metallopeptidase [Candidatus Kapabacteria bacterium]